MEHFHNMGSGGTVEEQVASTFLNCNEVSGMAVEEEILNNDAYGKPYFNETERKNVSGKEENKEQNLLSSRNVNVQISTATATQATGAQVSDAQMNQLDFYVNIPIKVDIGNNSAYNNELAYPENSLTSINLVDQNQSQNVQSITHNGHFDEIIESKKYDNSTIELDSRPYNIRKEVISKFYTCIFFKTNFFVKQVLGHYKGKEFILGIEKENLIFNKNRLGVLFNKSVGLFLKTNLLNSKINEKIFQKLILKCDPNFEHFCWKTLNQVYVDFLKSEMYLNNLEYMKSHPNKYSPEYAIKYEVTAKNLIKYYERRQKKKRLRREMTQIKKKMLRMKKFDFIDEEYVNSLVIKDFEKKLSLPDKNERDDKEIDDIQRTLVKIRYSK